MHRLPLLLLACCLACGTLTAQKYRTAVGLRLSESPGITLQQRLAESFTVEGMVQFDLKDDNPKTTVTVLGEQHQKLISRRLNVYAGAGLHKGWMNDHESPYSDPMGISLIGGAEMTIGRFNLSFDAKPAFNIYGGDSWIDFDTGISVRYVLFKAPKKKRNWKFWKRD